MRQFATFNLDDQLFGLDVMLVREVNQQMDFTPVPRSHDFVRGLINLRGQIVTVFDLGERFGLGPRQVTANSHSLILKTEEELAPVRGRENRPDLATCSDMVGLLVDHIGDVIQVDEADMEPPPANAGGVEERFLGPVAKLDGALLVTLNLGEILKYD